MLRHSLVALALLSTACPAAAWTYQDYSSGTAIEDVRAVANPVLRHRIITNFNAEAEGLRPDDMVARLIKTVPVDEREAEQGGKLPKLFRSANAG